MKKNFSKKTIYSASSFLKFSAIDKYSYNFKWFGRPIIQYPQDIVALQEIIWSVKPDLIIETGIAHGGSLIFSASTLASLDLIEALNKTKNLIQEKQKRSYWSDIDIRKHNKKAIKKHPFYYMIDLIEGSSTDNSVVKK